MSGVCGNAGAAHTSGESSDVVVGVLGVGVVGGKKAGAVHMKKLIMITLLQCRMTVEAIKKTEDTYKHQVQHQCKFCDRQFKGSTYT